MKNIFLFAIALLFPITSLGGDLDKKLHIKCIYPTVMIEGSTLDISNIGTGVILKSVKKGDVYLNIVATVAHLLKTRPPNFEGEIPPFEYLVKTGVYENWSKLIVFKTYPCDVVAVDYALDLAILKFTSNTPMPCAEVSMNPEIYLGNDVCMVGCGAGDAFRLETGKVNSLPSPVLPLKNVYRTSVPAIGGDSGAPLFHNYKVIGIVHAIRRMHSETTTTSIFHISYAIPMSRFEDSLIIRRALSNLIQPPNTVHQ